MGQNLLQFGPSVTIQDLRAAVLCDRVRQRLQDADWADSPSARTLRHSQQQLAGLYDHSQPFQNSTAKPFLDRTGLAPRPNTAPHAKLTLATARNSRAPESLDTQKGRRTDQSHALKQQASVNGAGQQQAQGGKSRSRPPPLQLQGVMVVAEPKSGRSSLCSTPCSTARRREKGSSKHSRASSLSSQGSLEGPDLQRIGRSTISSRAKAPRSEQRGLEPELRSRLANTSSAQQSGIEPNSNQSPVQQIQSEQNALAGATALPEDAQALATALSRRDKLTASESPGVISEQQPGSGRPMELREQQAAGISSQLPASDVAGIADTSRSSVIRKAGMTTTHRLTYGMADTYPELYQQAIEAGRAQPAPNLNFRSAWGESLSKAAQAAADQDQATGRSKLLSRGMRQTTYAEVNNQVHPAWAKRSPNLAAAFQDWVRRARLYYGEVEAAKAIRDMDKYLEASSLEDRTAVLAELRRLHVMADPHRWKSATHRFFGNKTLYGAGCTAAAEREYMKAKFENTQPLRPQTAPQSSAEQPAQLLREPLSRPITQDPSQLRAQADAVAGAAVMADAAASSPPISERLVITADSDAASNTMPAASSLLKETAAVSERPFTAGPASNAQTAMQDGVAPSRIGTTNNLNTSAAQPGTQRVSDADPAPWRIRAAWLQAQTNGDPAAELYKSSIPLGRAAGMGGIGPDSSAYQDSYGKDAAALAKSTAKEAVACKAQAARLASILQSTSAPFGKPKALKATTADGPFPVPSGFVDPPYEPGLEGGNGLQATTTGRAFAAAKDPAVAWESAAQAKRALDRSKAELRKITLPMGANGINQLMTWRTTYGADFEAWKSDIASSNLIAAHIKRIMQSPTATVGPVLGGPSNQLAVFSLQHSTRPVPPDSGISASSQQELRSVLVAAFQLAERINLSTTPQRTFLKELQREHLWFIVATTQH
ncbi:hypothetical protein WJX74_003318 [Apatococcus lobatus]|uniref:Uncharacterized protein n=1 Tax=Apatococcus lobatus TaxID=904363 RepID=A0AAW1RXW8_9CHLO